MTGDVVDSGWYDQTEEEKKELTDADKLLSGQARPTQEQVAWVFAMLYTKFNSPCTLGRLAYNRMQLPIGAKGALLAAGGMTIGNILDEAAEYYDKEKIQAS